MAITDLAPRHHGKSGTPSSEPQRKVDRVFESFWSSFGTPSLLRENGGALGGIALDVRVDAREDDKAYHITAELPARRTSRSPSPTIPSPSPARRRKRKR